ncbi:MAG: YggS family pyridoxal phosphate-dependent enzyme [Bacteroidales bacterium]|nr:YggS family pyridoxal phosphate-dependent enzyme [Clostridium sp.]MCM1204911.1 YggS family pyridoxal phosphate-dependent enzyme [Bacteroidales bacterium]
MLKENYNTVKEQIAETALRCGRDPSEITLIAVSKTKPLSDIEELIQIGVEEFGENKVQELCDKYEHVSRPVHFHLIGHLQTNKVKYIVDKACLIHSVDSVRLAKEIQKEAAKKKVTAQILIEVNVAKEESKFGLQTEEVLPFIEEIAGYSNIHVNGLMTIAPFVENPEENRNYFRALKQLSLDIISKNIDNIDMNVLSMGMTNDYKVAVEEGATMVRVGTAIFGARNYTV